MHLFMWISLITTLHINEESSQLLNSPNCAISLPSHSSNSQSNQVFNRKQHHSLQFFHVNRHLQLFGFITFNDIFIYKCAATTILRTLALNLISRIQVSYTSFHIFVKCSMSQVSTVAESTLNHCLHMYHSFFSKDIWRECTICTTFS